MMKRIWLMVVIMLCVLGLCVGVASAAGGTYEGMTWDLSDGTLTLGGTLSNNEVRSVTNKFKKYNLSLEQRCRVVWHICFRIVRI